MAIMAMTTSSSMSVNAMARPVNVWRFRVKLMRVGCIVRFVSSSLVADPLQRGQAAHANTINFQGTLEYYPDAGGRQSNLCLVRLLSLFPHGSGGPDQTRAETSTCGNHRRVRMIQKLS